MKEARKKNARRFVQIVIERFKGAEAYGSAVMISFFLLLSLFPLCIVLGNILSLFRIDATIALDYVRPFVPNDVMGLLGPAVEDILTSGSGGLLSLGALGLIWSSSRGINYLQKGMNKAYGVSGKGNQLVKRLFSLFTILLVILFLIAFLLVFSFGTMILEFIEPAIPWAGTLDRFLTDLKWPVTFIFLLCFLTLIYVVTPDVKVSLRSAVPGAVFSTLGVAGLAQAFSIYLRFASRTTIYGTLGAFFLLMFWMNFTAMILLLGTVLNASIQEYKYGKPETQSSGIDHWLQEKVFPQVKVLEKLSEMGEKVKAPPEEKPVQALPEGGVPEQQDDAAPGEAETPGAQPPAVQDGAAAGEEAAGPPSAPLPTPAGGEGARSAPRPRGKK